MTLLVVPIAVDSYPAALAKAKQAQAGGATAVEFRVDRLAGDIAGVCALVAASPLLCIVTCRHACETGGFDGPEDDRVALYAALAKQAKEGSLLLALDVEWEKWKQHRELWEGKLAPLLDTVELPDVNLPHLILSSHDFAARPVDLEDRFGKMLAEPLCDVAKLAWKGQGVEDCADAAKLIHRANAAGKFGVAIPMGEASLPARVLAGKWEAFMTFAALDQASGTAPGQPLLAYMVGLYRWNAIQPTTKVYGVIGCPVGHSMSPAIHNAGFAAVGFDGVYVPMRIEEGYENFARALDAWIGSKEMDFGGASVTIPHKENLMRYVEERGGEVEILSSVIGAANTLAVELGQMSARNTDYAAIMESVAAATGRSGGIENSKLFDGIRVAVVGAGGAARAAVAAFAAGGAQVAIFNRSMLRAKKLADDFAAAACLLDDLAQTEFDILVNGTPLGMTPNIDTSPLADGHPALKPGVVVFDTVYNPLETKLLKQAKAAGCICIPGTEMFVRQAAAQFHEWTGQDPPLDIFRKILAEKLGA